MLDIAKKELEKAAFDFYNMTKIMVVLFSDDKKVLYSYPSKMSPFCAKLRTNEALGKKCMECDHFGFENCETTKTTYIYRCHAGLTEAVVPIYENSVIIGYMMLGQVLDKKNRAFAENALTEICKKYDFDKQEMFAMLNKIKSVKTEAIQSAANIMSMCACYLYTNKIIKNRSDILCYQLKDYVDTHLDLDLSVESLCKTFYISKTKLYYLAKNTFGAGISDYVRTKRIEEAKKALSDTKKPVSQIAEETGFYDANYFSRIFKSYVGVTPREYRSSK